MTAPPTGYLVRAATWDDLAPVVELFRRADLVDWGAVDVNELVIREEWEDPRTDMARDTWLVVAEDDLSVPAGYASLRNIEDHRQLEHWGVVLPERRGRGLGSFLFDSVEARAAEHVRMAPPDGEMFLRAGVIGPDAAAHQLVEARGYRPVRHYWRMDGPLDESLAEPPSIPGVRIRGLAPGVDDRAAHAAHEEAFAQTWGFVPRGFDEWAQHRLRQTTFDPKLWFVAEEGDEIVGVLQGLRDEGNAWVAMLGVRPAWQRKGIGEALLRHAFIEYRRMGFANVGLGVDTRNESGASALYERVGLTVTRQFDLYEKRLR